LTEYDKNFLSSVTHKPENYFHLSRKEKKIFRRCRSCSSPTISIQQKSL